MEQIAESTFSFGIEPISKRTYQLSGKYKKKTKARYCRKSGLKYRTAEENTKPLILVGFIGMPSEPIGVSEKGVSL
ncbi:MAG: hypothetical protein RBR15_10210 [Sphaerochaeta sp.]|nr:hypothetical protein [Sphaerochaeta sp.]